MILLSEILNTRKVLGRLFVLIGISLYAVGQTIGAQTRFSTRDTVPDISKYVSVEECLAGLDRVIEAEKFKLSYWADTVELVGREEFNPTPVPAQKFSSACLAKFNPDSVNIDTYRLWIRLYLGAGNDTAALLIAQRKLSLSSWNAVDSSNSRERVIDGLLYEYSHARPFRTELIHSLIDSYIEGRDIPTSLKSLVSLYFSKARYELLTGDTVASKSWASKILSLIDSIPHSGNDSEFMKEVAPGSIAAAREIIESESLLDSLRISGHSYAMLRRSFWKDVTDRSLANEYVRMIGEKASPLVGDFKYSRNGDNFNSLQNASGIGISSPAHGKVSLVVFLYGGCRPESPQAGMRSPHAAMCLDSYTILHRLAKNYPDVEITIVTRTMGYLGELGPLTPEDEAEKMRWWWIENHKLPGTLIIANTEYFKLPGLDRRRIDSPDENVANYSYLSSQRASGNIYNKTVYLVDSDGTILEAGILNVQFEKKLKPILDIITKRAK